MGQVLAARQPSLVAPSQQGAMGLHSPWFLELQHSWAGSILGACLKGLVSEKRRTLIRTKLNKHDNHLGIFLLGQEKAYHVHKECVPHFTMHKCRDKKNSMKLT